MRILLWIAPLLSVFLPSSSIASEQTYICRVTGVAETWQDTETAQYWLEEYKDDQIIVNRNTGEVNHSGLGNSSFQQRALIHRGDSGNSFKVISSSANGWQAHYMAVEEYADGQKKNFVIVYGPNVWRGLCN